ncbi:sugar (pentulose or hexulose) kinase [Amycolatopsis bartoniae]|uniref:Xylulose kinase n=1 Tax=Amycolatopsis bartoniae TaxID=941986 RepID=A0A8H9MDH0_9PSEU|nr:FGGY family carbohydrate kinase [Amycolatopsis bartoniae]MBB2938588.1 sugar (pentulose or hexulose) kinase [Amycolatopsis bartoniae]GHF69927.1 xylulose kinase [Amycolatopsis bartoniae]
MQPLLAGLDVGTTASKAAVFTVDGRELATGRAATPWRTGPQGTDLDPALLLDAVLRALREALAGAPEGPVLGLGITGIGESGVLLDGHGTPVAPVIAWHDTRDDRQVRELAEDLGAAEFSTRTGLPLRGQWSLTKHRWLDRNLPAARSAVRRFNLAEWLVRELGGEEASDQSLASRTGWLEVATRQWWPEALEWSGLRPSLLPPLVTGGEPVGRVSRVDVPDRLRGAVLTLAGQDHQAAAVGAGAAGDGDQLDSCGTAEALVRTVPAGLPPEAVLSLAEAGVTVGWHVLAGRWCLLGATQGGLVLERVLRMLGLDGTAVPRLDREVAGLAPDPLRMTVEQDGFALRGFDGDIGPAAVWRAALEAVTGQVAELHEAMSRLSGAHSRLVVTGGWARSQALLAVKTRLLGPVHRPDVGEAGARGAALLAGIAAGHYAGPGELPGPELLSPSEASHA